MPFRKLALVCALTVVAPSISSVLLGSASPAWLSSVTPAMAGASSDAAAEKSAFNSAKELGTLDAWNAFLASYPTGFHADLARAYISKLSGAAAPAAAAPPQSQVSAPPPSPPAAAPGSAVILTPAEELPCSQSGQMRSLNSNTPAKIVFQNNAARARTIHWIDFNGNTKEYARIAPGEQLIQDTYLTHPWLALDTNGNCRQLFMPLPGTSVASLVNSASDNASSSVRDDPPRKSEKKTSSKKSKAEASAGRSCRELGMDYRGGQCVAKTKKDKDRVKKNKNKACPAGMYRNPLGQCQPNETGS